MWCRIISIALLALFDARYGGRSKPRLHIITFGDEFTVGFGLVVFPVLSMAFGCHKPGDENLAEPLKKEVKDCRGDSDAVEQNFDREPDNDIHFAASSPSLVTGYG